MHVLSVRGQGEFNIWYFGSKAGVDFNSGTPIALLNCSLFGTATHSSISDSSGNLLFYCNGQKVINNQHEVMPNGNGLLGTSGSQNAFSIQNMTNDSLYFIFTVGWMNSMGWFTNGLRLSILDLRLDSGLGDIVPGAKNLVVPSGLDASNAISGTRHANNRDAWIVVRKWSNNGTQLFASHLITPEGFDSVPVYSTSSIQLLYSPDSPEIRCIKISPDGTKLACVYGSTMEYCTFNSSTGMIIPLFTFSLSPSSMPVNLLYYVAFSEDSKFLYISSRYTVDNSNYYYQYDASKVDSISLKQTEFLIGQAFPNPGFGLMSGLQLANNGKIYGTKSGVDSLCVIEHPNVQGIGCQFVSGVLSLEGRNSGTVLPQFLQRYKAFINFARHCQGDSTYFSGDIWPPADSLHWDFGDPSSGSANFSNDTTPSHVYNLPGQYTIELFVRHIDNRTDTSWITITIDPTPAPDLGPDQTICTGDSVTFDAGACPGCSYSWDNITTGQTGIATTQTYRTGEAGDYRVGVTNTFGCSGIDTISLSVTQAPEVTTFPLSDSICSGETTNIQLISNLPNTGFSWTVTLISGNITGFSADSGTVIAQTLLSPGTDSGLVVYHIVPEIGTCVGDTANFSVTVTPADSVMVSITVSEDTVCDGTSVTCNAFAVNGGTIPSYQWQVNGINTGSNSNGFTYIPSNNDVVSCILTSYEPCTSGNPASSNPIIMLVGESPVVTLRSCFDTITTTNAKPIHLKGGIPLGGTYSGPGVDQITGNFNPAMAGVGSKTISYSYTNQYNCSNNATKTISVINPAPLTCGDSLTDIRDNEKYPTIQIGSQCWLAVNLNYGVQIPGSQNQRDNCIAEKYLQPPPGLPQPGEGSVYQWDELMQYDDTPGSQGLCPPGWHVPSEADWQMLFDHFQGNAFAGSPMLATGYSGFNAILSGVGLFNQNWYFTDFATMFWSSNAHGPNKAWAHGLNEYNFSVSYYPSYRSNAFSVRCVRD